MAKVSEAQSRAVKKYLTQFDTVTIRVPAGMKDQLKADASRFDKSLNTWMLEAIEQKKKGEHKMGEKFIEPTRNYFYKNENGFAFVKISYEQKSANGFIPAKSFEEAKAAAYEAADLLSSVLCFDYSLDGLSVVIRFAKNPDELVSAGADPDGIYEDDYGFLQYPVWDLQRAAGATRIRSLKRKDGNFNI